jgi:chorismate synthase
MNHILENISHYTFTILICLLSIYYLYEYFTERKYSGNIHSYEAFSKELSNDMEKYNISSADKQKIESLIESIVERKKKEKSVGNIVNACKNGLIRGCIVGFMSGGVSGAMISGTTYGLVNGVMHSFFE